MCIRVSAKTTLVLVAFSIENFVLPLCIVPSQYQVAPAVTWHVHGTGFVGDEGLTNMDGMGCKLSFNIGLALV